MRTAERRFRVASILPAPALALVLAAAPSLAAEDKSVLSLRAFAINMQRGSTGMLDIVVERWSTDDERAKLRDILVEKGGGEVLLRALQDVKPRCGYIRTSRSLGWDVGLCREVELPGGGRRIILATDRPVGFVEARNDGRSMDYEFTLIEIRMKADGKGEGKLVGAAKVGYDRETNTVEIENYGQEPTRLSQVEVYPKPKKPKEQKP